MQSKNKPETVRQAPNPTWLACWLQSLMSHHDRLFATSNGDYVIRRTVWNSARGRFLLPPRAWNRLPTELKLMRSTPVFKRSLKTFLFQTAYCT